MTDLRSQIIGVGCYLPKKVITNFDLEKMVDTSDEWIFERTGIKKRHVVEEELTADLAYFAASEALKKANMRAEDIDLIIVATTTPDRVLPATATKVQDMLGIRHGAAFDIQAACSGFVYALSIVDGMIKSGNFKAALVIGAETLSRLVNWKDRNTCVLFGDGAGAVVIVPTKDKNKGIQDTLIRSDGANYDILTAGGLESPKRYLGYIFMEGKEVYKHAVVNLAQVAEDIMAKNKLTKDDIDLFVPHQANLRIIESTAKRMGFPMEKTVVTVTEHANTSAASIPMALAVADGQGRIKPGDMVLFDAMGAGFTWGAGLVRF